MNFWDVPPFAAKAAPVLWTPNASTGERFVALILLKYESPERGEVATPLSFHPKQMKAMMGTKRAESALGIIQHVADFMRQQLLSGVALGEVIAPFDGFQVGNQSSVRGYSAKQVIDTAIRTLSAFGTRTSFDDGEDAAQRNSIPTRQFLRSLRSAFARDDDERRARFNRSITVSGSAEMTIDYAHDKQLVQVTSLPQSAPHLITLQKEAESKILELDITASLLRSESAPARSSLLINTASLTHAETKEARQIANELLDRLRFMSEQKGIDLHPVGNPIEAAHILESLELKQRLLSA
ncbi:hypothetical protein [Paraburkholderia tropica]|uniref:Uncharacterized protein n=1 Tax=Paraburkholderia tropica TaxID=92647 RepID=A0AAQ1GJ13_9BURK|nr:hypothetical protein [Paraburkholderia tropica]RQN35027.1 hypothetical protein EHZ25_31860 [Paraburkholderia tropica]SEK02784.1 hypothetical protein SAMN05216550_113215 [Paraburkholderia tropica]